VTTKALRITTMLLLGTRTYDQDHVAFLPLNLVAVHGIRYVNMKLMRGTISISGLAISAQAQHSHNLTQGWVAARTVFTIPVP
jgi:hypothetical protein